MTQLHHAPIRVDLFDGTLNGYQAAAQTTAIYPGKGMFLGLMYTALKGSGEAGEFNEKVGKLLRDKNWGPHDLLARMSVADRESLIKEIGDELWYIAAKCEELGVTLEHVASVNLAKLADRQKRDALSGSGDDR